MSDTFTICMKCKNLHRTNKHTGNIHVWYNCLCKAVMMPFKRDPYDGKLKPLRGQLYDYCRNVNTDGNCPHFEPKKRKWLIII